VFEVCGSYLEAIAPGPDGNLWFTEVDDQGNGQIGRIGPGSSPKPRGRSCGHPT